jgi:hypothetical protein
MLTAKIFINDRQIDEIVINNITGDFSDFQNYEIRKPQTNGIVICHRIDKGYMPLLQKALEILIAKKEKK